MNNINKRVKLPLKAGEVFNFVLTEANIISVLSEFNKLKDEQEIIDKSIKERIKKDKLEQKKKYILKPKVVEKKKDSTEESEEEKKKEMIREFEEEKFKERIRQSEKEKFKERMEKMNKSETDKSSEESETNDKNEQSETTNDDKNKLKQTKTSNSKFYGAGDDIQELKPLNVKMKIPFIQMKTVKYETNEPTLEKPTQEEHIIHTIDTSKFDEIQEQLNKLDKQINDDSTLKTLENDLINVKIEQQKNNLEELKQNNENLYNQQIKQINEQRNIINQNLQKLNKQYDDKNKTLISVIKLQNENQHNEKVIDSKIDKVKNILNLTKLNLIHSLNQNIKLLILSIISFLIINVILLVLIVVIINNNTLKNTFESFNECKKYDHIPLNDYVKIDKDLINDSINNKYNVEIEKIFGNTEIEDIY